MARQTQLSTPPSSEGENDVENTHEFEEPSEYKQELAAIRMVDGTYKEDVIDCMIGFRRLRQRVGPLTAWPKDILRLFRQSALNFQDRKKLCVFALVNGVDIVTFLTALQYLGPLKRNPAARQILRNIMNFFLADPERGFFLSAYNVKLRKSENLMEALWRRGGGSGFAGGVGGDGPQNYGEFFDFSYEPYPDHVGIIPELGDDMIGKVMQTYNTLEVIRKRLNKREMKMHQAREKYMQELILDSTQHDNSGEMSAKDHVENNSEEVAEDQTEAVPCETKGNIEGTTINKKSGTEPATRGANLKMEGMTNERKIEMVALDTNRKMNGTTNDVKTETETVTHERNLKMEGTASESETETVMSGANSKIECKAYGKKKRRPKQKKDSGM